MAENTFEIVNYYAKLLIKQYENKPKAYATILSIITPIVMTQTSIQAISFSVTPTSGTFVLNYNGNSTPAINWNDSSATIQGYLQALPDLSQVIVAGSIGPETLGIFFIGVIGVASLLTISNNNLSPTSIITVEEQDLILPLAVQDAFDIETAEGVQLDILGKYAGVIRTVTTKNQTIVLDDNDFKALIKFAVVKNNSGSSLSTIEKNLNMFFQNDFVVTDYKTMNMSFIFGSTIGSINLFLVLVSENLLPVPMAVGYSAIIPPFVGQFFGYSTYENGGITFKNKPYNRYEAFDNTWIYLQYSDFI